jgi:hypothetical protein
MHQANQKIKGRSEDRPLRIRLGSADHFFGGK